MSNKCRKIINDGIDQIIELVEIECTALNERKVGAVVRHELFWLKQQQKSKLRCFAEWHILQPHKRFRPGHALRLSRPLQWFCNKLARRQNGYQWLQALEQCLACSGIAISTEYFGGGFTISSPTWIHIRPFMTVRGRFYNLVREYALMKLYPEHLFCGNPQIEESHAQTVAFAVARAVGLVTPCQSKHEIVSVCEYAEVIRESKSVLSDLATELLQQVCRQYRK
jgi:hypothetical protein